MSASAPNQIGSDGNETPPTMRAIVVDRYGLPDDLEVRTIERPEPDAERVRVRVRAASINPADLHTIKGGIIIRLMNGLRRPKNRFSGADVAGVVDVVGANVTELRVGDEVFGTCAGSLAQYALGGKNLVPKPPGLSFEQAASVGIAGVTALQGLRDKGQLQPGQSVLINGASGGVGTFAVQIAKALGAEVTGVCSDRNADLVRSIGADRVIDYAREDFARSGARYDLIFDIVGNRSLTDLRAALKSEGTLVLCGGAHERGHGARGIAPLTLMLWGLVLSRFISQRVVSFIAKINKEDLLVLGQMMESGKLTPVIDRTYSLEQVPEAFRYLESGHARAKIVVIP